MATSFQSKWCGKKYLRNCPLYTRGFCIAINFLGSIDKHFSGLFWYGLLSQWTPFGGSIISSVQHMYNRGFGSHWASKATWSGNASVKQLLSNYPQQATDSSATSYLYSLHKPLPTPNFCHWSWSYCISHAITHGKPAPQLRLESHAFGRPTLNSLILFNWGFYQKWLLSTSRYIVYLSCDTKFCPSYSAPLVCSASFVILECPPRTITRKLLYISFTLEYFYFPFSSKTPWDHWELSNCSLLRSAAPFALSSQYTCN